MTQTLEPSLKSPASTQPIYIEAGPLLDKHLTGVGRFAARTIEAIGRHRPICLFTTLDPGIAISLRLDYAPCWGTETYVTPQTMAALGPIDADVAEWSRRIIRLPKRRSDMSLMNASAAIFPLLRPTFRAFRKEIGIFHDFTPMLLPWTHSVETIHHFGLLFAVSAPLHDCVIANSESTRADARWLSTLTPQQVVTSYPGPSLCEHQHSFVSSDGKPAPKEKIILVVSALEPRKNGPFLLKWFLNTKAIEPGTQLWWVGPKGWWTPEGHIVDLEEAAKKSTDRQIKFLGSISDQELCRLYQSSMLTIYPSLYEGFGFPVLDSLMHGTPVLASYNSSLAEFQTPGVFHFDAYDPATLDQSYRDFLANRDTVKIDYAGLKLRYSWDNFAKTAIALAE